MERLPRTSLGEFRTALRNVSSPLSIVTAPTPDGRHATTVGSFCAVLSAEPSVVVVLNKRSELLAKAVAAGEFVVNWLTDDDMDIALAMAKSGEEKAENLRTIAWRRDVPHPVLKRAAMWALCAIEHVHDSDDHVILRGRVREYGE